MEEIVRAFNFVIEKGWVCIVTLLPSGNGTYLLKQAYYWATSEWTAREIEEAFSTYILDLKVKHGYL